MITRVVGLLEGIDELTATVAVAGTVAIQVLVPTYFAERLTGRAGSSVTFHTLAYLESHGQGATFIPRVVGFPTAQDRRFFELFTTVKGIGNRRALRALAEDPSVVARAIARRDAAALQRLPEIGKRTAETVIAELAGKVEAFAGSADAELKPVRAAAIDGPAEEAVRALVALGEPRAEAERRVREALADADPGQPADRIIARVFAGGRP